MSGFLARTALKRLRGERPGAPRAVGAALAAGGAAGGAVSVLTYRLLRSRR